MKQRILIDRDSQSLITPDGKLVKKLRHRSTFPQAVRQARQFVRDNPDWCFQSILQIPESIPQD